MVMIRSRAIHEEQSVYGNGLQPVSVEQFVREIMMQYARMRQLPEMEKADMLSYGYEAGWLEELDVLGRNSLLERKTAARILHQFLRTEMKEAEEDNTGSAQKLQDLYDCGSCAGHVMQIYAKGIMDGYKNQAGRYIFGMGESVSVQDAQEMITRMMCPEQRIVRVQESEEIRNTEMISEEEAMRYVQTDKNAQLIDVRTAHEFEKNHLEGFRNIPMAAILKNPYIVSDRRDIGILLYCEEGYQSEIAANCLLDAGYEKVLYFKKEMQKNRNR